MQCRTGYLLLVLLALSADPGMGEEEVLADGEPTDPTAESIRYAVRIEGIGAGRLRTQIEEQSEALRARDNPPASYFHLVRRTRRDEDRFTRVLQSQGYYAAKIGTEIDSESEVWQVVYTIDPGTRFTFGVIQLIAPDGTLPPHADLLLELVAITPGAPALAQALLEGERAALAYLREHGYPFPEGTGRRIVVDHARHAVDVTLEIEAGPYAVFGEIRPEGLEKVRESAIARRLSWQTGDRYAHSEVERTQDRLFATGLFSLVRVEALLEPDEAGAVPMGIELRERKHRTIGGGLRYGTDVGAGMRGMWEHRNMRGMGERLRIQGTAAQNEIGFGTEYTFPYFRQEDQSLELSLHLNQTMLDAYDSLGVDLGVLLARKVSFQLDLSLGALLKIRDVEQKRDKRRFELLSTPFEATWRSGDTDMNPARGMRLRGLVEPFVDFVGLESHFVKADLEWINYLPLDTDQNWVLATRVRAGTMLGSGLENIPAYERYFAGGGGSVRGYKYQSVGVLDREDDPVGGSSILELGVEVRRKITDKIWAVGFVDAGWAGASVTPDAGELLYGAGVGLRYLTLVGPLRLDVAVPLDTRSGVDAPLQVYLSIGQAF